MGSQWMQFTRVSASVKTAIAFSLVWRKKCMRFTRRLLCFPWYGVTMRFTRFSLKPLRFKRVFASVKTAFAFSLVWRKNACVSHGSLSVKTTSVFLVWRYNGCVSNACPHRLRQLLRFPWYGVKMHAFHTAVYRLRRLLFSLVWR